MSDINKKEIDKLIHSVALRYNMKDEDMKNLVFSPYEFAYNKIKNLNLDEVKNKNDYNKLKKNFIFASFMKLVIPWRRVRSRNNRRKNINKINNRRNKK